MYTRAQIKYGGTQEPVRFDIIKGIVHPKMKILSLITHPHVVPNP